MGITFHHQLNSSDCGVACLKMVFKFYGKDISRATILKNTFASKTGVTLKGLRQSAEGLGVKTVAVSVSSEQLLHEIPLPAILLVNGNHFVVLFKNFKNKYLVVADPASSVRKIKADQFLETWVNKETNKTGKGALLYFLSLPIVF